MGAARLAHWVHDPAGACRRPIRDHTPDEVNKTVTNALDVEIRTYYRCGCCAVYALTPPGGSTA